MSTTARIPKSSFLSIETVHTATVEWWWSAKALHDDKYTRKVSDAVEKAVEDAIKRHPTVSENTRLCCQWEGVQLEGPSLLEVTAAGQEVALVLSRFKDVVPLDL